MAQSRMIAAAAALVLLVPLSSNSQTKDKSAPPNNPPAKKAVTPSFDEMMLFFPSKHPVGNWQPKGLNFEDVSFKADDGTRLHGWFCPCKDARAVLLYAHGNAGNLSFDARVLQFFQKELRLSVLTFDYRGYGKSEGTPTVEGVLKDTRAARKILAERAKVKETDMVLLGRSLGGAVVCQLAGESAPRALILECSFSSLRDVAEHHYGDLAAIVPKDKLDSAAKLAAYKGPLLQSHGDADKVIPLKLGKKLFEAAKGTKEFVQIAGGGHNDAYTAQYRAKVEQFIAGLP
jgi:fermentation-respiration switch protein FrsA (DUF1100 family)